MAKKDNNTRSTLTKWQASSINKNNRRLSGNINALQDQLSVLAYGIKNTDKIDTLQSDFDNLMKNEINDISSTTNGDTTSFITKLFSEKRKNANSNIEKLEDIFDSNQGQLEAFLQEQYRNRLVKQADLHEVATQLVELREAIGITRDAIVSADTVDGHINRIIKINDSSTNIDGTDQGDYMPIIEEVERKFKLQEKIKNFIVPNTLEIGEYVIYHIPYAKIFEDFMNSKIENNMNTNLYRESVENPTTLYDYLSKNNSLDKVEESIKNGLIIESVTDSAIKVTNTKKNEVAKAISEDILKNISISNDPVPLVCLEEGFGSIEEYYKEFVEKTVEEKDTDSQYSFRHVMKDVIDPGIYKDTRRNSSKKSLNKESDFSDIKDCYIKLIDPMHIFPIKIMDEAICYCYIHEEEIDVINGTTASSVYFNQFEVGLDNESNIIDNIADTIVSAFDKKFLQNNMKFKKIIVEAIRHYNLNNHKIRFQFIPKEYITVFKVNEDEDDNGCSIIEPSLFYAKLYLMLLLFKIMSIVLNSNDTKVNYIKSGLEKNVVNKVQEIARKKQQRQVTLTDMFSYTTLINKIGQGSEMYVPVGNSGERPIETEILSGQDIPLHNDLMEMLKKAYITGTGVPDVLMNYINEADFAKTLELANTRFHSRVVSYQLDFNQPITEMYKKILSWSTTIPQNIIDSLEFSFVQPKYSNTNITNDLINNHNGLQDFVVQLYYGQNIDNPENVHAVEKFKKEFARKRLSMINWAEVDEIYKDSKIKGTEEDLDPSNNSDNE